MSIVMYTKDISYRERQYRLKMIKEHFKNNPVEYKFFITSFIWNTIEHRVCICGYKNVWIQTNMGFKKFKKVDVEKYKITNMKNVNEIDHYISHWGYDGWIVNGKNLYNRDLKKYRIVLLYLETIEKLMILMKIMTKYDLIDIININLYQYKFIMKNNKI